MNINIVWFIIIPEEKCEYACATGYPFCVDSSEWCNGHTTECEDGSDETNCLGGKVHLNCEHYYCVLYMEDGHAHRVLYLPIVAQ